MRSTKILVLIAFSFLCFHLWGQDLHQDMAKINANYATDKTFRLNMNVRLLDGDKQLETLNYQYLQNKNKNYFRVAGIATVMLDSFVLIIDDRIKNVVLTTVSKTATGSLTDTYDSLLNIASSYKFSIVDTGKLNLYTLKFKKQEYSKIEIYYNPQTYSLQKLKIYYSDLSKGKKDKEQKIMEFSYGSVQPLNQSEKDLMMAETYYVVKKNKIVLTKLYKDYDLIDYRAFYQN